MPFGTSQCTHWFGFPGNCLHCLSQATGEELFAVGERGTAVLLLTSAASAPSGVPPMPPLAWFTLSHSHDGEVWRVLTTSDLEIVTQGQGIPDHQILHISGLQQLLAFCLLRQKMSGLALVVCAMNVHKEEQKYIAHVVLLLAGPERTMTHIFEKLPPEILDFWVRLGLSLLVDVGVG